MENLYLIFCTVYGLETQCANGLPQVLKNDVSSSTECINRVLPSTLRYALHPVPLAPTFAKTAEDRHV
jgi:hypothetical protein